LIRSAWVILQALLATVPLSLSVIIAALLGIRNPKLYHQVPRIWARWILWAAGTKVEADGLEHLQVPRPQIIAANHASWFDVLALSAVIPKRFRFVAKKELGRVPLWGQAWRSAGHISIDRTDTASAVASLEQAGTLMREDNSVVVIYPEGTRSEDGTLQPFKKGAFMLALQTHIEIVPAGVQGAHEVLPKHNWRVRAGRIIVRFGPPISTVEYDIAHREELMTRVRSEIQKLITPAPTN
jgi:1-acyl-sn-glycerol-3-phosphate acyltransferase